MTRRKRGETSSDDVRPFVRKLVDAEIESPSSMDDLHGRITSELSTMAPVVELLRHKDEERRATFFVHATSAWHRRFGFRLMKPLLLLGVVAAIGFSLQRWVDPTLGVAGFLAGAFSFYVLLQLFLHRWAKQDERALERIRLDYRSRLTTLRESLDDEGSRTDGDAST